MVSAILVGAVIGSVSYLAMRFVCGPLWRRFRRRPELRVGFDREVGRYFEEYQPDDGWEKRW